MPLGRPDRIDPVPLPRIRVAERTVPAQLRRAEVHREALEAEPKRRP